MYLSELVFDGISFQYDSSTSPLLTGVSATFPCGWTGIVGANGAGKSTLLKLALGGLAPSGGRQSRLDNCIAVHCQQRTDDPPVFFPEFLEADDWLACRLSGKLGIEPDWLERWETLSHGERKRAQIGVALWREPDLLAIDEPTNHIDREARSMLLDALHSFGGIGLIVSHDRALLDKLCCQCLFLKEGEAILRHGGYSRGLEQLELENQSARDELQRIRREKTKMEKEQRRRREAASRSQKRRSKRGLAIKDHDARFKRNAARVSGKDGQDGRLTRQMSGRLKQIEENMNGVHIRKEYELGIWMPGAYSPRSCLLDVPAGSILLGKDKVLTFPDLILRSQDHVALTGSNGNGKSSLIRYLLPRLNIDSNRLLYIPQELTSEESVEIISRVRQYPRRELGRLMTTVSRLGSRPQALLDTELPSPGEIRKLMLALGIVHEPHLIILDEPTNHLDLPSIECLENALAECPCALILVSHDERFLRKLCKIEWQLGKSKEPEITSYSAENTNYFHLNINYL